MAIGLTYDGVDVQRSQLVMLLSTKIQLVVEIILALSITGINESPPMLTTEPRLAVSMNGDALSSDGLVMPQTGLSLKIRSRNVADSDELKQR